MRSALQCALQYIHLPMHPLTAEESMQGTNLLIRRIGFSVLLKNLLFLSGRSNS